ncbi:MAG TPA: glycerate kinase [Acidimicrobiales bacterium]|nr:glycerate kinase [Acidimicrobiales bacterium]
MSGPDEHRRPAAVAVPDAFKGTATASEVADAMTSGALAAGWDCQPCPMSDGGEGFADVLAGTRVGHGRWIESTVTGPAGRPVVARWWHSDDGPGAEAVIESASASGLPLAGGPAGNDPVAATSRGTGELLVAAARSGVRRILLGVGGTAMTDGGRGALDAVEEAGGLGDVALVVACDVDVAFIESASVFAPQKGASPAQVAVLRERLGALATEYRDRYGIDVEHLPRSGAAGGLAGGLAVLGALLVPGFDVAAREVGLLSRMTGRDLVVTGEGRLDVTSWSGKVVGGVVAMAAEVGVPCLIVAGSVAEDGGGRVGEGAGAGGGHPSVQVVSLSERFGWARAVGDPAGCVARAVTAELSRRT